MSASAAEDRIDRVWNALIGFLFLLAACSNSQRHTTRHRAEVTVSQPVARHVVESETYTDDWSGGIVTSRPRQRVSAISALHGRCDRKEGAVLFQWIDPAHQAAEPRQVP